MALKFEAICAHAKPRSGFITNACVYTVLLNPVKLHSVLELQIVGIFRFLLLLKLKSSFLTDCRLSNAKCQSWRPYRLEEECVQLQQWTSRARLNHVKPWKEQVSTLYRHGSTSSSLRKHHLGCVQTTLFEIFYNANLYIVRSAHQNDNKKKASGVTAMNLNPLIFFPPHSRWSFQMDLQRKMRHREDVWGQTTGRKDIIKMVHLNQMSGYLITCSVSRLTFGPVDFVLGEKADGPQWHTWESQRWLHGEICRSGGSADEGWWSGEAISNVTHKNQSNLKICLLWL